MNFVRILRGTALLASLSLLSGCSTYPDWLPSTGPSREQVEKGGEGSSKTEPAIQLVRVDDNVARQLLAHRKQGDFTGVFGASSAIAGATVVGAGDGIEVSVWEAPPAMLFGGRASSTAGSVVPPPQMVVLPEQMVGQDGTINIPFMGHVKVAGHDPEWIERTVTQGLEGKANQPQVLVRVMHNTTATVTVVGEVSASTRMPLTARGERLLDALAAAGGAKQPVNKTTLQITRGNTVQSLPLETIIRDPAQNILLQPGDVITAIYKPLSFTVLGATGKNEEMEFEVQGISLAQAMARDGGLDDTRADAKAIFIFRFEDKDALRWKNPPMTTPEGKVPVIYQVDLKDPGSFFVAQGFPMDNKDVMYIANSPGAEVNKFISLIVNASAPLVDAAILKQSGL